MYRYRLFHLTLILLLTTGCSTIATQPYYEVSKITLPAAGVITSKELGETLVTSICERTADSWEISKFQNAYLNYSTQVLKPLGRTKEGMPVFAAVEGYTQTLDQKTPLNPDGDLYNTFCDKSGDLHFMCKSLVTSNYVETTREQNPDAFAVKAKYVDVDYPSLQQELIYNGRVRDDLKFVYRELSTVRAGNMLMRSPFQQDVQYEFTENTVIGFKGARLEIISANNQQIIYKLLENFPVVCE